MIALWTLCVVLDRHSNLEPVCIVEGSRAVCQQALYEWINRAYAWEARSHLIGPAFATCQPEVKI